MSYLSAVKKIAILGAGASGTTLFLNLVDQIIQTDCTNNLEIIIIEKSGQFGPGLAYSTQITLNLMNTPTFDLGIRYGDKLHFLNWLEKNESFWRMYFPELGHYDKHTPLPRKLYGLYLETLFYSVKKKAENAGISVKLILNEVIDIARNNGEYYLQFQNQSAQPADIVVSCVGLGKVGKYLELKGTPGYFLFPGKDETHILDIPRDKNVAIVGSRLSAIDSILLLNHAKRTGHTFVVSRTANMPNVIGKHERYACRYMTKEYLLSITHQAQKPLRLRKLVSLMKKEYFFQEGKCLQLRSLLYPKHIPITKFRYDIIKTTEKIRPWQAAFYSTNSIVNFAWNSLSDEDKKVFQKHYSRIFQNQRIAMPIKNAKKIYKLYKEKAVSFHKHLSGIEYHKNQYHLFFDDHQFISVPYLIDAAGLAGTVNQTDNRFVKNLINRKIICQDAFGFIHVNPCTMRAINPSNKEENFYVLGGLTQGTHLAANLIESIVELANQITQSIIKSLCILVSA
jgi:uncharacterized NAD(P)/FAD-binding protein YdhS